MEVSVRDIADLVGGTVEGDPSIRINRPSKIEEGGAGSISFLGNPKYEPYAYHTNASALLVAQDFSPQKDIAATLIRVPDVYAAVATLMEAFGQAKARATITGVISEHAIIHESAIIDEDVSIGAHSIVAENAQVGTACQIGAQVYIGQNVRIGNHVRLYPGARIMDDCIIGDHCVIHSNVVIGSDGFGFAPQNDGTYKKIPQLGNVILEDDVEVGSNTSIDRGSMGATILRKGVKLDNLIQVAHNVEIGENTVIAAQTGIAGSTKIGKNCRIGGQVGFSGHLTIADGTSIQAQSGLMGNVQEPNTALFGSPAFGYRDFLKAYALFRRLPDLDDRLRTLEKNTGSDPD